MVTPHLTILDIPAVVVNHTYKEIGLFPKDVVSGGTGVYYSADNIFIIGRQQEKQGKDVVGYNFIINVEKSRFVREKSRIPIEVTWEGGISKWSGLIDMAIETAKKDNRPSLIKVKTIIGYGCPNQGTSSVHGSPLGDEGLKQAKKNLDWDYNEKFYIPKESKNHFSAINNGCLLYTSDAADE